MMERRTLLKGSASAALALMAPMPARADDTTGITPTEIRIGSTTSLSGPVSALAIQDRLQDAFFKMINEKGGVAGRQIKYIYYDDGFSPPKTVEQVRRLSLSTCRRQSPGAATGRTLRSPRPAISAFPDMAVGSACTSSFSRLAQRSLALPPAYSRCHQFVTR